MTNKITISPNKKSWINGLSILGQLWKRGLFPKDLERHYFLHWFVIYDGNIIKTAKALEIHRNTIQGHFLQLGYSKKSVQLRHSWQKLNNTSQPFDKKFQIFYEKFSPKTRFTPQENAGLVALWQTRFPFKTLTPHYLLWAIRAGKSKDWVLKTMGYSYRHRARLLSHLLKPKSRDAFWLSPLKPTSKEIYSARYRNVLAKQKKR